MPTKLSQKLIDAYMVGDANDIDEVKREIDKKFEDSRAKRDDNVIKVNTVLNDDSASAISVYNFLNEAFGIDWWEWEFETLERMLWIKYGVALESINRDKIYAIRHLCRSDGCFSDWYELNQLALSFAGVMADFEYLKNPSPGMIVNIIKAINYMRPDRQSFFGNDVIKYICVLLKNEGIYAPPLSIFNVIGEEMKSVISPEVSNVWPDIYRRYKDLVFGEKNNIQESVVDIQAKRLLKAESSALKYGAR